MVEVVGDRLIELRQLGVDQKMMVARIVLRSAGRSKAHILQPEMNGEFGWKQRTILHRILEVDLRTAA